MDRDNEENSDSVYEIDPDYENTHSAIRNVELQEQEDNKLTEEKLRSIMQIEFDKELQTRQKQLEEIENKVCKAQKLLHIVRYVLISSYYNTKASEYESTNSTLIDSNNMLIGQNRIHPAVKKLIGKNKNSLNFLTARTKRKAAIVKSETNEQVEAKKVKLELKEHIENKATQRHTVKVEPQNVTKNVEEPLTNRKKIQYRVVIGNLSFYKKSLELDNLTHKWMVFVKLFKGAKDGPEVTNLAISKVIFFLHPSYKPHDVVEIGQSPFHLSRRGWGEFPLKVQIHFKSSMNKPVEVIHEIKLDNTFTERQTLGNQTTVPLFLYDDWSVTTPETSKSSSTEYSTEFERLNNNFTTLSTLDSLSLSNSILNDQIISIEPIEIEPSTSFDIENIKLEPSTSYEHNYCYDNVTIKEEPDLDIKEEFDADSILLNNEDWYLSIEDNSLTDHGYSLSAEKKHEKTPKKNKSPVKQPYNELIYGLGPHYLDPIKSRGRNVRTKTLGKVNGTPEKNAKSLVKVLKTVTGQSIRFLPESFSQVLLNNGSIVSVKLLKSPASPSKSIRGKAGVNLSNSFTSPRSAKKNSLKSLVNQEKYLLKLPKHAFKNMGEALPYLLKRIPLWCAEASNVDYRCTYPFMACSQEEFSTWNIGKRLAAEWSRAKTIKRIVAGESYSEKWTTKAIFMYARSHCYSPLVASYRLFKHESLERRLIAECYQNDCVPNGCALAVQHEDEINITSPVKPVIDNVNSNNSLETCVNMTDKRWTRQCVFVKETALDVGVVLKPEVLISGVSMNASERIIFEAVKCFAENLIRRSRHHLVCQPSYKEETAIITTAEVNKVLEERKDFQSIKTFKQRKRTMEFFS